jgi:endonuclease/exonuclease/phosphatase family metal-dependent hydrolase
MAQCKKVGLTRAVAERRGSSRTRFRVVSYNVHSCVGTDGVFAPARIAEILGGLDADFIALQEVEEREYLGLPVSRFLAESVGLCRAGLTTHKRAGFDYGNVLLSRVRPVRSASHDIAVPRREPRGVIEAEFDLLGTMVRVVATHFGLSGRERRAQLDRLLPLVKDTCRGVTVVCADFNEWAPFSRTHRILGKVLGRAPAVRTFPSNLATLSLDRIYAVPRDALTNVFAVRSRDARRASDHLPIVADFVVPQAR